MDAPTLISTLAAKGVTLTPDGNSLIARPRERLTDADREAIRQHKADLIAQLRAGNTGPNEKPPNGVIETKGSRAMEVDHFAEFRKPSAMSVTPDSRHPLIAPAVRAKLETIEAEARAKGWPAELLWNADFWDKPRGLASLVDPDDEIGSVTADYIEILKTKRDLLRFRRHVA